MRINERSRGKGKLGVQISGKEAGKMEEMMGEEVGRVRGSGGT